MSVEVKCRVTPVQGVEWTNAGGEIVLLDTNAGLFFGLNELSSEIWQGLLRNETLEQIIASILTQYDADAQEVETDVLAFVALLAERNLARVSSI